MPTWTWAAASRRGTAHERDGERRQDAFRIVTPSNDGFLTIVACDGAGSAAHGGDGARITAWTLGSCARKWLSLAERLPDADAAACWMILAHQRITSAAARRGLHVSSFATTAVMAISDGATTLTVHVGDGAVVARTCEEDRQWSALSWPEQGEFASTTRFVTEEKGPLPRIAHHEGPIDRLAVMTDGLERLALDFRLLSPHAAFLGPMSEPLTTGVPGRDASLSCALALFLDSPLVNERTDDDKTLCMAALS